MWLDRISNPGPLVLESDASKEGSINLSRSPFKRNAFIRILDLKLEHIGYPENQRDREHQTLLKSISSHRE